MSAPHFAGIVPAFRPTTPSAARPLQSPPNVQDSIHAAGARKATTPKLRRRHGRRPGSGSPGRACRPGFNLRSFPMSALFSPTALVVPFENLRMSDVEAVGGKNASLGEMISQLPTGVRVPTGFATTAHAFRQFLAHDGLAQRIEQRLTTLDTEDVRALAAAGAEIRRWVEAQPFPADLERAIRDAFATLTAASAEASFAVRSSATAEDLPDASF